MEGTLKRGPGDFTLPGEAGYEAYTLEMAKKWGADVIRDCDGTKLSDEILSAGYDIYSTLCIIREDPQWAKANSDKVQQNFLMSEAVTADGPELTIEPLKGYFTDQFRLNLRDDPKKYWQVFDRTTGVEVPVERWSVDPDSGAVTVSDCTAYHRYTVNFLVYRIWEEISMYNQITNHLDKERLMAIEVRYPETQARMLQWLDQWCRDRPDTDVVRFTSLFYNFVWFWGEDLRKRNILSDWASYDFTVTPLALKEFEESYGYAMSSEDFVNKGRYNITHNDPSPKYRDWMDFTNQLVVDFGRQCVEVVHRHGKKAYVFYDDSWVGVEPYGERFKDIGFDGVIKCVFNAFETRLCAGVQGVASREIRLHPYLFPTGLSGEPTFSPGGNPTADAKRFWINVRRALLRESVDRIGLGGYLHLVQPFPDFCDYMEGLADEFRTLKALHSAGGPADLGLTVAVLHSWGSLRTWSSSGHLHEHPELDLTNILEALAGLPVKVRFISFDDVREGGVPPDVSVVISAGTRDSAWSGAKNWEDPTVVEALTRFVARGGGYLAFNEGGSVHDGFSYFALSEVLGLDRDEGDRICSGKYRFDITESHPITRWKADVPTVKGLFVLDGNTAVLKGENGIPALTAKEFRAGRAVYWGGFAYSPKNARALMDALLWAARRESEAEVLVGDNYLVDWAHFPATGKLVAVNGGDESQKASVILLDGRRVSVELAPHGMKILEL